MEAMQGLWERIAQMIEQANVDAAFGEPQQLGEWTVIPVAEVQYGFGAGMGGSISEGGEEGKVGGEGGGGGAGGRTRPLAYIKVGPDGVEVEPILDEQRIALAGIFLAFWTVGWFALVLRALFGKK